MGKINVLTSSQENPIGLRRFGYEETLLARHVCAREVVDSTAGQYSVIILVARILFVQKADAAGFVWTLTGIKVCPMPRVFRLSGSYLRCD